MYVHMDGWMDEWRCISLILSHTFFHSFDIFEIGTYHTSIVHGVFSLYASLIGSDGLLVVYKIVAHLTSTGVSDIIK